jgi:hypothetical protein
VDGPPDKANVRRSSSEDDPVLRSSESGSRSQIRHLIAQHGPRLAAPRARAIGTPWGLVAAGRIFRGERSPSECYVVGACRAGRQCRLLDEVRRKPPRAAATATGRPPVTPPPPWTSSVSPALISTASENACSASVPDGQRGHGRRDIALGFRASHAAGAISCGAHVLRYGRRPMRLNSGILGGGGASQVLCVSRLGTFL